jgi:hypothetical protein
LWLGRHIINASYPLDKVVPHVHGPLAGTLQQFYDEGEDLLDTSGNFSYTPKYRDPALVLRP